MALSLRRMTRREFRRGLERLRQARTSLWSDSNWSVTETEEMRLSDSRAVSQSVMWRDLWVGSRTSWERLWLLSNWRMRFASLEFKPSKRSLLGLRQLLVVKESRTFFMKEWSCEFVLSAGRRSVEAGEDDRLARLFQKKFDRFKRSSSKGWVLTEWEKRMEDVLVDYGNTAASWKTRKRSKCEARRIESNVCIWVRDHVGLTMFQ